MINFIHLQQKYNVENPMQNNQIRLKQQRSCYMYDNIKFESSWELIFYIWLQMNQIKFEYQPKIKFQYVYNSINHFYFPDFLINNNTLVEIKGEQFINKETNTWQCPYNHELDKLYEEKHQFSVLLKIM